MKKTIDKPHKFIEALDFHRKRLKLDKLIKLKVSTQKHIRRRRNRNPHDKLIRALGFTIERKKNEEVINDDLMN